MTLFVEDLEGAKEFYRRVFKAPVVSEDADSAVFDLGNMLVNLLRIPAARELIGPRAVGGPESGSRFQLTVEVEDVDEAAEDLGRRGVELLSGPMDRPWGVRTASFTDPAGHVWEIAQRIPGPRPDGPPPGPAPGPESGGAPNRGARGAPTPGPSPSASGSRPR